MPAVARWRDEPGRRRRAPSAAEDEASSLPAVEAGAAAGKVHGFPPIADYAFLSDCETCALIASGGSVEWLCLPRPDSPSVFGSMLDRSAGIFGLVPEGIEVPSHRRYLPGSMVLETTWQTPTGWLQVYDCLVTHRWHGGKRREQYKRAPGDFVAAQDLLARRDLRRRRRRGHPELPAALRLRARAPAAWSYSGEGYDSGDGSARQVGSRPASDVSSIPLGAHRTPSIGAGGGSREGESAFAALSWGEEEPPELAAEGRRGRSGGRPQDWRHWLKGGDVPRPSRGAATWSAAR